ncbi:MAG: hypothetical protein QOE97_1346 [Pseudonocardiales bacterium]|nr:hypothetical protein [Pseudonocardiales bacterium]
MLRSRRTVRLAWLTAFAALVLGPVLIVLLVERPAFRNTATELSLLAGVVGLSLLVVAAALPARLPSVPSSFGIERVLLAHRLVTLAGIAFVVVHLALVFVGDPRGPRVLDLRHDSRPMWAATTSTGALLLLVGLALNRRSRRPRYEGWRLAHVTLAVVVLVAAGLHVWWLASLVDQAATRFVYTLTAEVAAFIAIRRSVWLPIRAHRRAYVVHGVRLVGDSAVTIIVRAHGHAGLPFHAGQFAWLKIESSPFVFDEHSFFIASAAEHPDLNEITIKVLGDFSELLSGLRPGRRIYLDGPYGAFTFEGTRSSGFVFIAAGVGIAPVLSMLRTLADRCDPAHHEVVVGARSPVEILARYDLEELRGRLDLTVTEVVGSAPDGWPGEVGRIDGTLLDRVLPRRPRHCDYFVCGPPEMVVDVGRHLREWGVPPRRIHAEQFEVT